MPEKICLVAVVKFNKGKKMSDCCSSASCSLNSAPRKQHCPGNNALCSQVSQTTILHHIKQPWHWEAKEQAYYFCSDPGCEVVYFGQDNSIITQSELRTEVGIKAKLPESIICYCFGVTYKDVSLDPDIKAFVIDKTRDHSCACETRNPSGKCCLKDFP